MTPVIRNTIATPFSALLLLAQTYPWRMVAAALAASLLIACILVDWSAQLSPAQAKIVRSFVIRTHSPAVRNRYNRMIGTGRLTVKKTETIIELAKQQEPSYGLISAQPEEK